ncbi:MAG: hypothetical protein JNL97_13075, partial [Verrucomicrobiales bacterium]|nr:hypothetical protein [Verrucomicrobiales bacterium]
MNTTRGLLRSVGIDSALHPRFEGTPRGRAALLVANLVFLTNGADLFAASSIVKFSTDTYSATERSRAALVLLVRTNIVDAVAGVTLRTTDQAAIGGQDYLRVVTNIVFDVGETYRTVSIPLSMDGLPEGVETFKVGLSDPLEGTVLRSGSSAAVQILDPGSFEFEWNRYWAAENEGSVDVGIRRNADNDAPSAVDVRTFDVSARSGLDYEGFTNRVFFAAGERFKRVPVRILQDTAKEGAEHFTLALGNPTAGSSIGRSGEYARVQVLDDNPTVHFATDAAWVHEAAGSLVVRVERGGGPSRPPFSVGYATKALTATPGADYGERSGTIVFAEGESLGSFTVPILPDTEIEEDEQFLIELNHVEGEAVLGTPASIAMRITIVDASGESPHRFENVRVDPSGNWRLSLAGQAHARFEGFLDLFPLEQSSNLVDWSSLGMLSATNLSGSPLDYLQPAPGRESPRFLRTPTRHFLTPAAPPTGPHAVGRMDRWVTDPGRGNRFGVSTNHSFQVALWYPATARAGAWPLPCFDEAVLRDTSFSGTNWMDRMPYLVEYGAEGLDLAPGEQRLPIVLISAGGGGVRQDLWEKADELASHGYFVMAPDH